MKTRALLFLAALTVQQALPPPGIAGRIVSATTGRAIPGARAELFEEGHDAGIGDVADADGRFHFTNVAPGSYLVGASAPGYRRQAFGEEPVIGNTLVTIRAGQTIGGIEFQLHCGGTIAGVVIDDFKEPVVAGVVRAFVNRITAGEMRLVSAATARTDDQGSYRLTGLDAGVYIVGVVDGTTATFAPNAASVSAATTVVLALDAEKSGINIQITTSTPGTVDGLVAGPGAVGSRSIELAPDPNPTNVRPAVAVLQPGGRFVFNDVPPGRYQVIARPGLNVGEPQSWGLAPVLVTSATATRPVLTLREGARVSGSISPARASPLTLVPFGLDQPQASRGSLRTSPDGTFVFSGVPPGRYRWTDGQLPIGRDQRLVSVFVKGADVTDVPFVVAANTGVDDVRMVVTDIPGRVTGSVRDAAGKSSTAGAVVVVAAENRYWTPASRRLRVTRADTEGNFEVRGMPAGRYLVAHVAGLVQGQLWDVGFLKSLAGSQAVSVADGQTASVQLRLK